MKLLQLPRALPRYIEPSFAINPQAISWIMKNMTNPEYTDIYMLDGMADVLVKLPFDKVKQAIEECKE